MQGLTLIELIVALVLVGALTAITAVFLQVPMQSYFMTRQRLDLTDSVELAMRHLDQELRLALPNSVRVFNVGAVRYIEFLATRGSGRYRSVAGGAPAPACPGGNNQFETSAETCFNSLGSLTLSSPVSFNTDYVVVNNLDTTSTTANAYWGNAANDPNKARLIGFTAGAAEAQVRFISTNFQAGFAASQLFHVVSGPVMYACDLNTRQLLRYSNYPIRRAQAAPPANATQSVIVANLQACTVNYNRAGNGLMQAIVSIDIVLSNNVPGQNPESTGFVVQVPVSKTP